jgi:hypothetical protein
MRNQKNHNILIVSFFFAPSTEVGAKRFSFLSQFFSKYFSHLHVLTSKNNDFSEMDFSLPHGGIVHTARMIPQFPFKRKNIFSKIFYRLWESYLCLIDPYIGWILPAFFKGIKIIKKNNINLIIATAPPSSSLLLGYLLSLCSNTKLFLDYRDPWSNRSYQDISRFRLIINKYLENIVIRKASALIFCSEIMKNEFVSSFSIKQNICHVITNGFYDHCNIEPLNPVNGQLCMLYAGHLRSERRLKHIVPQIAELISEGELSKDSFNFILFSNITREDKEVIDQFGLSDIVKVYSKVSYNLILRYLKGSDILYLLSGSDFRYAIPFKFFDYLSVKKPIFAIAPKNSSIYRLMDEIDCGECAMIYDGNAIKDKLRTIIRKRSSYTFSGRNEYLWCHKANSYISIIRRHG